MDTAVVLVAPFGLLCGESAPAVALTVGPARYRFTFFVNLTPACRIDELDAGALAAKEKPPPKQGLVVRTVFTSTTVTQQALSSAARKPRNVD